MHRGLCFFDTTLCHRRRPHQVGFGRHRSQVHHSDTEAVVVRSKPRPTYVDVFCLSVKHSCFLFGTGNSLSITANQSQPTQLVKALRNFDREMNAFVHLPRQRRCTGHDYGVSAIRIEAYCCDWDSRCTNQPGDRFVLFLVGINGRPCAQDHWTTFART